jgi:hypothetical protein
MKIKLGILCLSVVSIFYSASIWAQEKDPFFPSGPRSAVTVSTSHDNNWGRDPFSRPFEETTRSPASSVRGVLDLIGGRNLTGIIYSKHVRVAIIGGEAVKEGGMVGDQKIVDIRRRSIVLQNSAGSREEVFLEDFSIRK